MIKLVSRVISAVILAVAALVAFVVVREWRTVLEVVRVTVVVARIGFPILVGLLAARVAFTVVRFVLVPVAAKRNYPRAVWCRLRWRWLTRNIGLAYVDPHRKIKHRAAIGPAIGQNVRIERPKGKTRHPHVRIRADEYGVFATMRTLPRVGRAEVEKHSQHIADAWKCHRVQVAQPKPGRLIVRGLRTDPLAQPFDIAAAPRGVYTVPNVLRPYLGRDEWANDRYLHLPGLTGITIGGLPGYGKTEFVDSLHFQLAGSPAVQFANIDGKGGGDYDDWIPRAWIHCNDELDQAAEALELIHDVMRRRLACVREVTGHRNAWHRGPTPDFPLIVTTIDECHTFFDLDAVKGDKHAEQLVRSCRHHTSQLVRKGRAALMLTIPITQKQTGDAIPTNIRDNCGFGLSFAVKTRDAAVVGLGDAIRDYPSYDPTRLQEAPTYVGVATASLPTGADPFVRLRFPHIPDDWAALRAAETAHLRADPTATLPLLLHPTAA